MEEEEQVVNNINRDRDIILETIRSIIRETLVGCPFHQVDFILYKDLLRVANKIYKRHLHIEPQD